MNKFWLRKSEPLMNLDGGAGGGEATPVAAPETAAVPQSTPAVPQNPLLTNPIYSDATPQVAAQTPAAEAVRKLNFGGREVPVLDPVVEEVHRDYTELTRTYTQTSQAMKQLEVQNAQMQQMLQLAIQQQQQTQTAPTQQQQAAPSPEELEAAKESFMEKFYEDPQAAIRDMAMQLIQQEVKPVIDPIQEERNFQREAQRLQQAYPDFRDTIQAMQQLTQTMPELEKLGLEKVYLLARNLTGQTPATVSTPTETVPAVASPEVAREQFMNDPAIRQQIFNDMLREKQQQQAQVPPVMANQAGGAIPSMPPNTPKSLREGSKALLRHLGIGSD